MDVKDLKFNAFLEAFFQLCYFWGKTHEYLSGMLLPRADFILCVCIFRFRILLSLHWSMVMWNTFCTFKCIIDDVRKIGCWAGWEGEKRGCLYMIVTIWRVGKIFQQNEILWLSLKDVYKSEFMFLTISLSWIFTFFI